MNSITPEFGKISEHPPRSWRILRTLVLAWTAFTSVFTWTSTNRALWRPSLSSISFGDDRPIPTWLILGIAAFALTLFYLNGRRRLRAFLHAALLAWHVGSTSLVLWLVWHVGAATPFIGAIWGWRVPIGLIAVPFTLFTLLTIAWIAIDRRIVLPAPRGWSDIRWKLLAGALALTPLIALIFRLGAGYDRSAQLATGLAIVQWLLLISAVDDVAPTRPAATTAAVRGTTSQGG